MGPASVSSSSGGQFACRHQAVPPPHPAATAQGGAADALQSELSVAGLSRGSNVDDRPRHGGAEEHCALRRHGASLGRPAWWRRDQRGADNGGGGQRRSPLAVANTEVIVCEGWAGRWRAASDECSGPEKRERGGPSCGVLCFGSTTLPFAAAPPPQRRLLRRHSKHHRQTLNPVGGRQAWSDL